MKILIIALMLVWDYSPIEQEKVIFVVEQSTNLTHWIILGYTTNLTFRLTETNTSAFYRVGAQWRTDNKPDGQ